MRAARGVQNPIFSQDQDIKTYNPNVTAKFGTGSLSSTYKPNKIQLKSTNINAKTNFNKKEAD